MTNTHHITFDFRNPLRIEVKVKVQVQSDANAQKLSELTGQLSDSNDDLQATVEQTTPKKEP